MLCVSAQQNTNLVYYMLDRSLKLVEILNLPDVAFLTVGHYLDLSRAVGIGFALQEVRLGDSDAGGSSAKLRLPSPINRSSVVEDEPRGLVRNDRLGNRVS